MATVIYAGSFDPITNGHMSIIMQAAAMFSHVRVLVAVNPDKQGLINTEDRLKLINNRVAKIPNVSADSFGGYVVEYAKTIGASYLIRGVRDGMDAQYEMKLAQENLKLAPGIKTILLPCDPEVADISSSKIKSMIKEDIANKVYVGKDYSKYVDELTVLAILRGLKPGK